MKTFLKRFAEGSFALGVFLLMNPFLKAAVNEGEAVVVLYNQNMPESLAVAEHYAAKRAVPKSQIIGLDLPNQETISRRIYTHRLEKPLRKRFQEEDWFELDYDLVPATKERIGKVVSQVKKSSIRYLALCYGVPLRIESDKGYREEGSKKLPEVLRRNEAAVDSELASLPMDPGGRRIYGFVPNPAYGATNSIPFSPEKGLLMVSRLDGPSPKIAKQLVDLAMQAETDGLWGRAYFDLRGLKSGTYKRGDDWLARSADFSRRFGIETYVDNESATLPESLPMSDVAMYAGWYDTHVSGPFRLPKVDFMPGAIAYHIHSFSAKTVRSGKYHWVGPLLERGVTATMGCVYEPYLDLTPNLDLFFSRLFMGLSFAEAAYASQPVLSWQTTMIGDPLYRPFAKPLSMLRNELAEKKSPLWQWAIMLNVNRFLNNKVPLEQMIAEMSKDVGVQMSAILTEKLGDLHRQNEDQEKSEAAYRRALELNPSPEQALRIRLRLAAMLRVQDKRALAVEAYLAIAKEHPDYVGLTNQLGEALALARMLKDPKLILKVEARMPPSK